jgi:hypothetical protein
MTDWRIRGDERRYLLRRYVDLQIQHVRSVVDKYTSQVREDLCVKDLIEDIGEIIYYAFSECPDDPKSVEEMAEIWHKLSEKIDV